MFKMSSYKNISMLRQENLANCLSLLLPLVPVLQCNAVLCLVCPSCVAVPQWTGGQVDRWTGTISVKRCDVGFFHYFQMY